MFLFFKQKTAYEITCRDCSSDVCSSDLTFRLPSVGEPGYNEKMQAIRVRLDFRSSSGTAWVDDVSLRQVEALDEWQSLQTRGFDRHSVMADPLFVDANKDDYRLKPDSPALRLGFQPIPVEKIGPYRDELRASWPIVEAAGAREHPSVVVGDPGLAH